MSIDDNIRTHTWPDGDVTVCVSVDRIVLVESIPLDVDYGMNASFGKSLYEEWKNLLSVARDQIDVASFYWSLTGEDINVNSSTDASVC